MTVELALLISSDGIALAHRQSAGHWAILKDVSFSDPNLDKAMKGLRKEAEARAGEGFSSLLILPDDQILYSSLTAPTDDPELTAYRIEEGLEGMTPYAVSELVYDWRAIENDRVKLAVVARETLDEARGFAETHGFKPAGFAAMPPQERFPGVPLFDLSGEAEDTAFSDDGIAFGPDTFGQEPEEEAPGDTPLETEGGRASESGDAEPDDSLIEDDSGAAASEPATGASDASDAMPAEETAAQAGTENAQDEGAKAEAALPEPEPEPDPEADALAEAADRDPEEVIAAASDSEPGATADETGTDDTSYDTGIDATRPPLEDPSLTEPVAPLEETPLEETGTGETEADRLSDAIRATRNASAAMDTGEMAQDATPEFSTRTAPMPARETGDAAGHETAWDTLLADSDEEDTVPAGQNPLAERLSRVRDASKSRGARTAKPVVPPAREAGAVVPPARKGRLSGLTAGPFPGSGETGSTGQTTTRGIGGRLGGLIGLGRNGKAEADAPAPARTGARAISGKGRLTTLGAALRTEPAPSGPPEAAEPDAPAESGATDSQDANLTGGLLGRKPDEPTGRSYRTGLLLTIILLILLAAIAVWSALFLPNSPVARLLGSGEQVAAEDPLDAPDAPIAITAPPAIGELATVESPPGSLLDEAEAPADAQVADLAPEADVVPEDEAAADGIDIAAAPETEAEAEPDAAPAAVDVAEVAPLPPLPVQALPSLEETEAAYAEYGIWQRPPDRPDLAPIDSLSDLGLSAIDGEVAALDAISLPTPRLDPSETLRRIPSPPPFGSSPARTAEGLVEATPEGVITPDGVLVTVGTPPVQAIPRPREAVLPARTPTFSIQDAILGTFRPEPRPGDLGLAAPQETQPGQPPITRASLSPQPRTVSSAPSTAEQASAASLFPQQDAAAPTGNAASTNAVARSLVPAARPGDMEAIIASAVQPEQQDPAPVIEAAAVAPGPSIPSNADVARAATQSNQMRLREVNLIGVTGTASDRRALVRLPSGRFVRVGVGDRLNGGRVAAIGASTLQYVRGGRTVTLDIPG